MQVQFEFTPDDLIDVHKRMLARSNAWRSAQMKGLLATAIMVWVVIFLMFYKAPVVGAITGLFAAGVSALLYPGMMRRALAKRVRAVFKETFGDAKFVLCEVELRPDGVWVRQMNLQVLHEWPSVTEIIDTSDSVDIFSRDGSAVVVRNKAFASPEQRLKFITLARAGLGSTHNAAVESPQPRT
jgi:hypothetical protein